LLEQGATGQRIDAGPEKIVSGRDGAAAGDTPWQQERCHGLVFSVQHRIYLDSLSILGPNAQFEFKLNIFSNLYYSLYVDIKGADLGVTPLRDERRDFARDVPHDRETAPGVIVEIGRPADQAGTYNARGIVEGSPAALKIALGVPAPGTAAAEPIQRAVVAPAAIPAGTAEALRMPGNAQVQTLAAAAPQVAVSLRATLPMEAAHLRPPSLALTAGIQTLATNALKQAEKGHATAEHEDEADPLHRDKDQPLRETGKRRGR
jgi:hypothetical protein